MKTLEQLKTELLAAGFLLERPALPKKGDIWFENRGLTSLENQYNTTSQKGGLGNYLFYYYECTESSINRGEAFNRPEVHITVRTRPVSI